MKKYSILLILFFTFCSQTSSNETVEEVITPTTELIIEETKDMAKKRNCKSVAQLVRKVVWNEIHQEKQLQTA